MKFIFLLCFGLLPSLLFAADRLKPLSAEFSGKAAFAHIATQLSFGPRYLSAKGHQKEQRWLLETLRGYGGHLVTQTWQQPLAGGGKVQLQNIFYRINPKAKKRILFGTHYDSRRLADKDLNNPTAPVPGANDSASGVAVLLELARLVTEQQLEGIGVDFVFFDGEEGEEDNQVQWAPMGSLNFVREIKAFYPATLPELGIVVDMVCDKELTLYYEKNSLNSAPKEVKAIWKIGRERFPATFRSKAKYRIYDDHSSLMEAGIPSLLLIDFDYPPFHSIQDDITQCSPSSLQKVGDTLWNYLKVTEKKI